MVQRGNVALVVFLRGINVGGHRHFRPSALARQLDHLGVRNIGAAGTFVIWGRVGRSRLRAELLKRLPFATEIVICNGQEIVRLASRDWFSNELVRPDVVRFASVLSRTPRATPSIPTSLPSRRRWLVKVLAREKRFVVGVYRRHMKVISYLGSLDRVFGVPCTTRNWNTINAIAKVVGRGANSPR
jgi:uncharacterized protein (DUF1697 family)